MHFARARGSDRFGGRCFASYPRSKTFDRSLSRDVAVRMSDRQELCGLGEILGRMHRRGKMSQNSTDLLADIGLNGQISEGDQADQTFTLIEHRQPPDAVFSHDFSGLMGVLIFETANGIPVHQLVNFDEPNVTRIIRGTNNNIALGNSGDNLVTLADGKDIHIQCLHGHDGIHQG